MKNKRILWLALLFFSIIPIQYGLPDYCGIQIENHAYSSSVYIEGQVIFLILGIALAALASYKLIKD